MMKTTIKSLLLLVSLGAASVISCQDEPLTVSQESAGSESAEGRLVTVDTQIAAMKSSVKDVKAVQEGIDLYAEEVAAITGQMLGDLDAIGVKSSGGDDALAAMKAALETEKALFVAEAVAIENYVASIKADADWENTALSTLARSKSLAEAVGSLEFTVEALGEDPSMIVTAKSLRDAYDKCLKGRVDALASGVAAWLGEPFGTYYALTVDGAKMKCEAEALSSVLEAQKLDIESLGADEAVSGMKASVTKNEKTARDLASALVEISSNLDEGYASVISYAVDNQGDVDDEAISEVNKSASVRLLSVETSFDDLMSAITACETQIAELQARLDSVEGSIDQLLSLIQSVTFVSDYSVEAANAYYNLDIDLQNNTVTPNETYPQYADRTPTETIKLNYLVRPASAAAAFASSEIWNDGLKVIGYYAPQIRLSAVSAADMIDFTITDVSADTETGLVSVSVENNLSEAFYFKKTGAKLALSITSGSNDFTTRFVEILPKDKSTRVYVESIALSKDKVEIDDGEDMTISAIVTPDDATNPTVSWTSSDENIVKVSAGKITAVGVGEATVTATTNDFNEWGQHISATCAVTVKEAVRLTGPAYVEVGGKAQMTISYPTSMSITSIVWTSSNEEWATIDENGWVSGLKYVYDTTTKTYTSNVTINCHINSDTGEYDEPATIKVVALQPSAVKLEGLADDAGSMTMKLGEKFTPVPSLYPEEVDASHYRFVYGIGVGNVLSIDNNTQEITAKNVGSSSTTVTVYSGQSHIGGEYWAPGRGLSRTVNVTVEPYWVKSMSFASSSYDIQPNTTLSVKPIFESDVEDKEPSYPNVTWVSSNTEIATVDATTGLITGIATGTCQITATTTHEYAVPSGESQISKSFSLTVSAPTKAINPGDFFYSDGDWSSTKDDSKDIIGIVIAATNVCGSDTKLVEDGFDKCSHGLVLGLNEYSGAFGSVNDQDGTGHGEQYLYHFLTNRGIEANDNESVTNGYALTNAYAEYRTTYSGKLELFDASSGVAAFVNNDENITRPADVSTWYVPSFYEMYLIYSNLKAINTALEAAGGTQLSSDCYWSSSCRRDHTYDNSGYHDMVVNPFDMSTGTWKTDNNKSTERPVRVVLAF